MRCHADSLLEKADHVRQVVAGHGEIMGKAQLPSLVKEGWLRHQVKWPRSFDRRGRGGLFNVAKRSL